MSRKLEGSVLSGSRIKHNRTAFFKKINEQDGEDLYENNGTNKAAFHLKIFLDDAHERKGKIRIYLLSGLRSCHQVI